MYKRLLLLCSSLFIINGCGNTGGISTDKTLIPEVVPEILNSFSGTIDENATFGTKIGVVDLSNLVTFKMKDIILSGDGSENFLIDKTGLLLLNKDAKIDYETKKTYNLVVTVTDVKGNSKATLATIELVDIPEKVPVLSNFTATIAENSASDTIVGKVNILDRGDSEITAMSLNGDNSNNFTIDVNGTIKVAKGAVLDYETKKTYTLLATAINKAGKSLSATVSIILTNRGEIVPIIKGFEGSVLENAKVGFTIIGTVAITDAGDTPIQSMRLSGDGNKNFQIDSKYGMVTLSSNANIDYEKRKIYNLGVIATNSAGNSIVQNITIRVIDSADVTPIIKNVAISVVENTPTDTIIGKIDIITVGDTPISKITLSGNNANNFRVDTQGNIYIVTPPDYETKYQYVLKATAINNAGDSASQTVTITITDIPDVVPTINIFSANIRENIALNVVVGTIPIISVGDSPIKTIVLSGIGSEHFSVDNKGKISIFSITPIFDTQKQKVYNLKAIAKNEGGLSTPTDITITLEDIANKVPLIESLNANIVENSQATTIVGIINIKNTGDSPITSITLTGDGKEDFVVDNQGIIRVVNPPDYEKYKFIKTYNLKAKARNTAGNSNIVNVNITVLPIADVVPIIDNFSTTINENLPIGTIINSNIPIIATGDTPISKISLTGVGAEYFTVGTNGQITIAKSPDYETQNKFNLTAIATNKAGISLSKSVSITIIDIPDIKPVIENFTTTIKETLAQGKVVGHINIVTKGDTNISSINLSGGNAQYFNLATDGTIKVALNLDYKTITSYSLVAVAKNGAGNSISKSVSISIEDVPNIPAQLTNVTASIDENVPYGTFVKNIPIIKGDRNITNIVLSGANSEHFRVENNGSIYVVISPNFEARAVYNLKAIANSISGTSPVIDVIININNKAENVPIIKSFVTTISETTTTNTIIGQISFTKGDSNITGVRLIGTGSNNFTVDNNGSIKLINSLLGQGGTVYTLEVEFSNNSGPSLLSNVIIIISKADRTRPTVIISSNFDVSSDVRTYLYNQKWRAETVSYNFNFSEDVSNFKLSDINISGADLSSIRFTGSGASYSLTLAPALNSVVPIIVKLDANKTVDLSANPNKASSVIVHSVNTYQPFITIWKTDNTGSSANNQININVNSAYSDYNYSIDWGDTSINKNVRSSITHTYASAGVYTIKITGKFDRFYHLLNQYDAQKLIGIKQWGTIGWTDMSHAFDGCINLTNSNGNILDVPNLTSVRNLSYMFANTYKFNQDLSKWNVIGVTNMSYMFANAYAFNQNISTWITKDVTNMDAMFNTATLFNQDLSKWIVSSVTTHLNFNLNWGGLSTYIPIFP